MRNLKRDKRLKIFQIILLSIMLLCAAWFLFMPKPHSTAQGLFGFCGILLAISARYRYYEIPERTYQHELNYIKQGNEIAIVATKYQLRSIPAGYDLYPGDITIVEKVIQHPDKSTWLVVVGTKHPTVQIPMEFAELWR